MNSRTTAWLMSKFNIGKIDRLISRVPIFRVFYKFMIQRTINYDFPTHLFIEPTNACNFRCRMCPRTNQTTATGRIDWALFKKIVDEAKEYGPRNFCLHLFGEPLLDDRITEMFAYIKNSHPHNTILLTTNGSLLDQKKAEAIVTHQIDKVAISLTSIKPEEFAEKTGVDALKTVEKNIINLVRIKKNYGAKKPLIFFRLIVDESNEQQTKIFQERWRGQGVIAELRDQHNYGGNVKTSHVRRKKTRYPCYHLWLSPAIHWDGTVSVCCDDFYKKAVLGDARRQSIHEIWNGPVINYYRRLHLTGHYEQINPCKDCDVWNIYSDLFFFWQKK